MLLLSDEAHNDINRLYNRKVYLTNNTFCQSFVSYCQRMSNDFINLEKGRVRYTTRNGFRVALLSAIQVTYRISPSADAIIIYSIGFVGLRHLHRLCSFERRMNGTSLGRRPTHISASMASDYIKIPKGDGGFIGNDKVEIVQRKGTTSHSGKPLFNYLYKGRIISKVDFLSCTPFSNYDGTYKAYAYGVNGKCYWVFPSGRRLIKESIQRCINRIIIESINNFLRGIVNENRDARIRRIVRESVDRFINQIVA